MLVSFLVCWFYTYFGISDNFGNIHNILKLFAQRYLYQIVKYLSWIIEPSLALFIIHLILCLDFQLELLLLKCSISSENWELSYGIRNIVLKYFREMGNFFLYINGTCRYCNYKNILSVLLPCLGGCVQQGAVGVRGGGVERQPVLCTTDYL
jgi:hypothetical protein